MLVTKLWKQQKLLLWSVMSNARRKKKRKKEILTLFSAAEDFEGETSFLVATFML